MQKKVGKLAKKLVTGLGQVDSTCPSAGSFLLYFTFSSTWKFFEELKVVKSRIN